MSDQGRGVTWDGWRDYTGELERLAEKYTQLFRGLTTQEQIGETHRAYDRDRQDAWETYQATLTPGGDPDARTTGRTILPHQDQITAATLAECQRRLRAGEPLHHPDGTAQLGAEALARYAQAERALAERAGLVAWETLLTEGVAGVMAAAPGSRDLIGELTGLAATVAAWLSDLHTREGLTP